MRDHASLRNQLWFLLLRFFRDVIIIFSDCDGIKSFKCESSLWRLFWCICRSYILLWWRDIFKISFIHRACFFFPINALTQRARSSARDSFWKDFTSISKKNHHRDRRKFYVNERRRLFRTVWPRVIHRKKRSVALSRSIYVVPSPYYILGAASYYKILECNLCAFSGTPKKYTLREIKSFIANYSTWKKKDDRERVYYVSKRMIPLRLYIFVIIYFA